MPKGYYQRRITHVPQAPDPVVILWQLIHELPLDTWQWTATKREQWFAALHASLDLVMDVVDEPIESEA
jgi:hypothetical protein